VERTDELLGSLGKPATLLIAAILHYHDFECAHAFAADALSDPKHSLASPIRFSTFAICQHYVGDSSPSIPVRDEFLEISDPLLHHLRLDGLVQTGQDVRELCSGARAHAAMTGIQVQPRELTTHTRRRADPRRTHPGGGGCTAATAWSIGTSTADHCGLSKGWSCRRPASASSSL
jgi:hypothetical protein